MSDRGHKLSTRWGFIMQIGWVPQGIQRSLVSAGAGFMRTAVVRQRGGYGSELIGTEAGIALGTL